jgi:hypothetical protein
MIREFRVLVSDLAPSAIGHREIIGEPQNSVATGARRTSNKLRQSISISQVSALIQGFDPVRNPNRRR